MIKKEQNETNKKNTEEFGGKMFEDLTKEEMEKLQGQGNSDVHGEGAAWDLLTSKGNYICRK